MGRFDVVLLDNDGLFNTLLAGIAAADENVGAELDEGSYAEIPFISHFSTAAQDSNGPGLWKGTLTVNLFVDAATGFAVAKRFYAGIHAWNEPGVGVIPGIGGITEIGDISAFSRIGEAVQMEAKSVVQYTGSFEYAATHI